MRIVAALLLLSSFSLAQGGGGKVGFGGKAGFGGGATGGGGGFGASCASYTLTCQNFETASTGYDNGETWTATAPPASTLNPAYTTSPLLGSQSLRIVPDASDDEGIFREFTGAVQQQNVYFFFLYTPVATSASSHDIFSLSNAQAANAESGLAFVIFRDGPTGKVSIWDGTATHVLNTVLTAGTTYSIWGEWHDATPSNEVVLYIASGGSSTKPGSATDSQALTNGTGSLLFVWLYSGASQESKFDHVLVSTSSIGSNP